MAISKQDREARLKEALRANLRMRKMQDRTREGEIRKTGSGTVGGPDGGSAGGSNGGSAAAEGD